MLLLLKRFAIREMHHSTTKYGRPAKQRRVFRSSHSPAWSMKMSARRDKRSRKVGIRQQKNADNSIINWNRLKSNTSGPGYLELQQWSKVRRYSDIKGVCPFDSNSGNLINPLPCHIHLALDSCDIFIEHPQHFILNFKLFLDLRAQFFLPCYSLCEHHNIFVLILH